MTPKNRISGDVTGAGMDRDAVGGGEGDGKRLHQRFREHLLGVGGILVAVKTHFNRLTH